MKKSSISINSSTGIKTTSLFLILGCIIVYGSFLLGKHLYVYNDTGSDTFDSYWPFISELRDYIRSGELPFWSFRTAGGNNLYATSIFLGDPFTLIYAFFPHKTLPFAFAWIATVKICLSGYFFYKYSTYLKFHSVAVTIGAILYAFNGYIVLWGQHYQFVNVILYVPFLFWGYEKLLREKKSSLFVLSVFLLAVNSFYFFFMVTIFFYAYGIVVYLIRNKFVFLDFIKTALRTILFYALGVGLSAFLLLPVVTFMLSSPRLSGQLGLHPFQLNQPLYYITCFFRLFSNNALGTAGNFAGIINYYEAPILFSGVLSLLLLPQLFFNSSYKQKSITTGCILVALLFLIFPFFSSAFNAFNKTDYRWTFGIVVFCIIVTVSTLSKFFEGSKLNNKGIVYTAITINVLFWILYLYSSHKFQWNQVQGNSVIKYGIIVSVYSIIYTCLLLSFKKFKKASILSGIILICAFTEMITDSYTTVNKRDVLTPEYLSSSVGYMDATNDIVKQINLQDDGFYRINKSFNSRFLDDALIQRFNGIKSYNSLNHPEYLKFLEAFGIPTLGNNTLITGLDSNIQLESLMTVKYLISQTSIAPFGYTLLGQIGGLYYFVNQNSLPFGFVYNKAISETIFDQLDKYQKENAVLKAAIISNSDMDKYPKLPVYDVSELKTESSLRQVQIGSELQNENMDVVENNFPRVLKFRATTPDPIFVTPLMELISGRVIVSFTATSPISGVGQVFWKSKDSVFTEEQSVRFDLREGTNDYQVDLGYVNNIDAVRLDISQQPGDFEIGDYHVMNVPIGSFTNDVANLGENALVVTKHSNNEIKGSVNSAESGILFISIPYDKGWNIQVDGERTKLLKVDMGLSGVPITKGMHQVEMKYNPPNLFKGLIISVISALFLASLYFVKRSRSKRVDYKVEK